MNFIEILRDFDGWNWSSNADEIENPYYNILYQNLRILLGNEFLETFISNEQYVIDYIELMKQNLAKEYGKKITEEYITNLFCMLIILQYEIDKDEKDKWIDLQNKIERRKEELSNKAKYIEELSKKKKDLMKKLQNIDQIKNDKEKLEHEFIRRNENAEDITRIFSINHLVRILKSERQKILEAIEEITKMMDPKQVVEEEKKIEKDFSFVNMLVEKDKSKEEILVELQKIFIDAIKVKIKNCENKKELLEIIYQVRYWNLLPVKSNSMIKDFSKLKSKKESLEKDLLNKAKYLKMINVISLNEETNIKIIDSMLELRMIELEKVEVKVNVIKDEIKVEFYDSETLEKMNVFSWKEDKDKLLIKKNKKVQLWI